MIISYSALSVVCSHGLESSTGYWCKLCCVDLLNDCKFVDL